MTTHFVHRYLLEASIFEKLVLSRGAVSTGGAIAIASLYLLLPGICFCPLVFRLCASECGVLEVEIHVSLYFQILRIHIQSFKKFRNEIVNVANGVLYDGLKSQCKLICIVGYMKLTNPTTIKFVRFYHFYVA
jgi:hypothetical protein